MVKGAKLIGLKLSCCGIAIAAIALCNSARAQTLDDGMNISGTLDTNYYGTTPLVTQANVTSSVSDAGDEGPNNEASSTNTSPLIQLSNAYAKISADNTKLNLFISGSIIDNDTHYIIAIQTNGSGVSNLNGKGLAGNLNNIEFDTGFAPNVLLDILPAITSGTTGAYYPTVNFKDISTNATKVTLTNSQIPSIGNNNLLYTAVGTKEQSQVVNGFTAPADPGFLGANTGLELQLPLTSLGYTAGQSINVLAFPAVGSSTRTDNQILAPFTYPQAAPPGGYSDYTYIDANRQFDNDAVYPGNQFFVVPGNAVPEPSSLSVLVIGAIPMLRRRSRKQIVR